MAVSKNGYTVRLTHRQRIFLEAEGMKEEITPADVLRRFIDRLIKQQTKNPAS